MKHLVFSIVSLALVCSGINLFSSCNNNKTLETFPSDTCHVYNHLTPNENGVSPVTYGSNNVMGDSVVMQLDTDSSNIYANFNISILELHPNITTDLLSFVHGQMSGLGLTEGTENNTPCEDKSTNDISQKDFVKSFLDEESKLFYNNVPSLLEYGTDFNLGVNIYPVFLNEDFVTYVKYGYSYTGGAHGNVTSFLQSYNLKTGETVKLEDIIEPDKYDALRERIVKHMASSYPIYENITSVNMYLDSLNSWLEVGAEPNVQHITLQNYPLHNPGIHQYGLVFSYEKYELTPGYYGCPTIVLTYDEIRYCLKSPLKNYVTVLN